jgi:cob(I)alamin adenosyltransferase
MKIYTKTGDTGFTSLYGGKRISKADIQIDAYGKLDELNVAIGKIRNHPDLTPQHQTLIDIQEQIFSLGSYLASDFDKTQLFKPELKPSDIQEIENQIDAMDAELEPLKYFVLPGGSDLVSDIHFARVICRNSERQIVAFYQILDKELEEKAHILQYLNRLSDYLFVLSRWTAKKTNTSEFYWMPKGK